MLIIHTSEHWETSEGPRPKKLQSQVIVGILFLKKVYKSMGYSIVAFIRTFWRVKLFFFEKNFWTKNAPKALQFQ